MLMNECYLSRLTVEAFLDRFTNDNIKLLHFHDPEYEDKGFFPYVSRLPFTPGIGYGIVLFTTELIVMPAEALATLEIIPPKLIAGGFAFGSDFPLHVPKIIIIDELTFLMDDMFA